MHVYRQSKGRLPTRTGSALSKGSKIVEDRLGSKLMQQQLAEAHAAAASTTGGWTIVWRPRGVEGVLEALTSLVEAW